MKNVKLSLFLIAPFLFLFSCNNTEDKFSIYDPNESETKAYLDQYCVYETAVEECLLSQNLELSRKGPFETSFISSFDDIRPFVLVLSSIESSSQTEISDGKFGSEEYESDYRLCCYVYDDNEEKCSIKFRFALGCSEVKIAVINRVGSPFQPMYKRERRYTFDETSARMIIDAAEECFESFAQINTSNESEVESA